MPANKPRVLLVGAGRHGLATWATDILPPRIASGRIHVLGVVDPSAEARARALLPLHLPETCGWPDCSTALHQLNPDLVIVASSVPAHEEACLQAAQAGAHLFIEKPVCGDLPACCRVAAAVHAAGVRAAVNMSGRFETEKQAFAQALASGLIGQVQYLFARLGWNHEAHAAGRANAPHPYLTEGGVHVLDMLRQFAGGRPKRVFNLAWPSPGSAFTGLASTLVSIEFDHGVRAALEGTWTARATLNPWREEYIRADGSTGSLLLDHRELSLLRGESARSIPYPREGPSGTAFLFDAFLDWMSDRRPDHPTNLNDNLDCMALLFAANASADQGQAINVMDFLAQAARPSVQSPSAEF